MKGVANKIGKRLEKKGIAVEKKRNQWPRDVCKGFESKRHKCIAMKYSTTCIHGGSLCSQQSINMADSPKATIVQVTLADPLSRYLRGTCVGCTILSRSIPDDTSTTKNQKEMRVKRPRS